jgi:hypothetical protein
MGQRKAAAVSMTEELFGRAKERAESLGMTTFSAYVVQLIRADVAARGAFVLSESDSASAADLKEPDKAVHPTKKQAKKKP